METINRDNEKMHMLYWAKGCFSGLGAKHKLKRENWITGMGSYLI